MDLKPLQRLSKSRRMEPPRTLKASNRVVVPWRLQSWVIAPPRPFFNESPGCIRSRAWIWPFHRRTGQWHGLEGRHRVPRRHEFLGKGLVTREFGAAPAVRREPCSCQILTTEEAAIPMSLAIARTVPVRGLLPGRFQRQHRVEGRDGWSALVAQKRHRRARP